MYIAWRPPERAQAIDAYLLIVYIAIGSCMSTPLSQSYLLALAISSARITSEILLLDIWLLLKLNSNMGIPVILSPFASK